MPYDITFGAPASVSFWTDVVVTVVFSLDIVANFLIAYEDHDSGKLVFDNYKIAFQYIKTSFLIDLFSTIPVDLIFTSIEFNTNLLKASRITKFLKFFKLIRLVKFVTFSNSKKINTIEKEIGKDL